MMQLTISLPETTIERLSLLAKDCGTTVESFAGQVLTAHTENGQLNLLRLEIVELREDLARAVEVLLTTNNDVNENEAKAWVRKNIRRP